MLDYLEYQRSGGMLGGYDKIIITHHGCYQLIIERQEYRDQPIITKRSAYAQLDDICSVIERYDLTNPKINNLLVPYVTDIPSLKLTFSYQEKVVNYDNYTSYDDDTLKGYHELIALLYNYQSSKEK